MRPLNSRGDIYEITEAFFTGEQYWRLKQNKILEENLEDGHKDISFVIFLSCGNLCLNDCPSIKKKNVKQPGPSACKSSINKKKKPLDKVACHKMIRTMCFLSQRNAAVCTLSEIALL